ncbi:MAG: hypothetical protein RLZZ458_1495 [Planctomycetota bacterium]|jgi:hypothetical protein
MHRFVLHLLLAAVGITAAGITVAQDPPKVTLPTVDPASVTFVQTQDRPICLPMNASELPAGRFTGTATNQTFGLTDTASFTLHQTSAGTILTGRFGEQQLFGRFQSPAVVAWQLPNGEQSGFFNGLLQLGDDGSGFPSGTAHPFKLTLRFTPNGVQGVYTIENPAGFTSMGTVTLK